MLYMVRSSSILIILPPHYLHGRLCTQRYECRRFDNTGMAKLSKLYPAFVIYIHLRFIKFLNYEKIVLCFSAVVHWGNVHE